MGHFSTSYAAAFNALLKIDTRRNAVWNSLQRAQILIQKSSLSSEITLYRNLHLRHKFWKHYSVPNDKLKYITWLLNFLHSQLLTVTLRILWHDLHYPWPTMTLFPVHSMDYSTWEINEQTGDLEGGDMLPYVWLNFTTSVRFTPGKETRYPLHRRLDRPQGWCGRVWRNLPPTGLDPWPSSP
jgi:hypothetical protein